MTRIINAVLCLLLVSVCALPGFAATVTWDSGAGGGNLNWSAGANWSPDGTPLPADIVIFGNTGTTGIAGVPTNIVDASLSVTSLRYESSASFHTTQINSGQTLTVNGGNFYVGPGTTAATNTNVNIQGSTPGTGTLTFNNASFDFVVGRPIPAFNGPQNSTLDASDLGTLNITANRLDVGNINPNGNGDFTMAANNNVTVNQIRVGGWNNAGTIRLGTTNVIHANSIELGWAVENQGGAQSRMQFDTGLTNPTITIRDKVGTGRAGLLMGWGSNGSGTGILDLTGGTADVMLSTAVLGQPRGIPCCTGDGVGTMTFNAGTVDATTLVLGRSLAGTNAGSIATGTVNVNGGTLIAGQIQLADVQGPSQARGFLNLAGGTVRATTIAAGPGAGAGTAVRQFNFTSGTLTHKVGLDLNVSSAVDMRLLGNGLKQISADAGSTVTINANIQNSGGGPFSGLTKIGAGTLLMNGNNTYTGNTLISAGTVGGVGAATSDFTVAANATLSPGASAGTFRTDDLTMLANSNMFIEIGGLTAGTQHDQVLSNGAVSLSGNLIVKLLNGFTPQYNDSFTIIDGASVTGEFSSVTVLGAMGYFDVVYLADQVLLTNFTVPEPSTITLLGLAGCLVLSSRRRNKREAGATNDVQLACKLQ